MSLSKLPRTEYKRIYSRQCEGKKAYTSKYKAKMALRLIRAKGMHAYECQVCFKVHVGHFSDKR